MELHYTRLDYGLYDMRIQWWDPDEGDNHYLDPDKSQDRASMVKLAVGCLIVSNDPVIDVFIDGSEDPIKLKPQTIQDLLTGRRDWDDFIFGHSQYTPYHRMREAISQWFVLRPMPGQAEHYECPACGRGAYLEGHLHCEKCGLTFITAVKYWGVSADLLDSLENHKCDRYYIDRVWNPNPPWMTREELMEAIALYQRATMPPPMEE